MSTDLDPTQLAIEFLRRDKTELSPAQYLKRLKQLELEFADLLTLSATELKEEIFISPGGWACINKVCVGRIRR